MRILVTGTEGQVVRSLTERAGRLTDVEVVAVGRPALDLARPEAVAAALDPVGADVIVNAAAYTAVDQAESEPELADTINGAGAGAVAAAAARRGLPVVQISTDYVFDGSRERAYGEEDATGPVSAYGRSKLAGERAVQAANANSVVLRTAWVYSPFGKNFAKTMLRLAGTRDEVAVVDDQIGAPTSALDIADAILAVAAQLVARPGDDGLRGVFHMSAAGRASWADFAEAIFAASRAAGGPTAQVKRITTAEFPTPARRPAYSRLDCGKLEVVHGVTLPDWRESVPSVVERLLAEIR
ncbi:dTDP-4-dehydrorhamnose reductase [Chelatococcus reniformis]|uniref:dTDP-4-dehydrorhamnose reductase n=1 Tax=Chelatococcus reniformis TaxID=1494448 RepID=A0A916TZS0_9HYPH|nr:dTDP-4-dehydrorhamnose reductase [Chelatococcus reniformis]GGC53971.1 NAD(P)-dependent oxidoreductase [Chelatococcus reniformis]